MAPQPPQLSFDQKTCMSCFMPLFPSDPQSPCPLLVLPSERVMPLASFLPTLCSHLFMVHPAGASSRLPKQLEPSFRNSSGNPPAQNSPSYFLSRLASNSNSLRAHRAYAARLWLTHGYSPGPPGIASVSGTHQTHPCLKAWTLFHQPRMYLHHVPCGLASLQAAFVSPLQRLFPLPS